MLISSLVVGLSIMIAIPLSFYLIVLTFAPEKTIKDHIMENLGRATVTLLVTLAVFSGAEASLTKNIGLLIGITGTAIYLFKAMNFGRQLRKK